MAAANGSQIYKRLLGLGPVGDAPRPSGVRRAAAANDGLPNTQPIHPAAAATSPASSLPAAPADSARRPVASTGATSYPVDSDAAATLPASSAAEATCAANATAFTASTDASTGKACGANSDAAVHTNLEESADLLKKGFHQEEKMNFNNITTTNLDVSMKLYASNLFSLMEDISSRFLMLEKRTGFLESAVDVLISQAQTTAGCSMQRQDLQMTGKSESDASLTQLPGHQDIIKIVYAGIQNQGGTCYLNCIIQTLFHLPLFREIICQIEDIPQGSAASALKDLFYQMKYSNEPACTSELTTSLGWNAKRHEDVVEKFEILLHELMKEPCLKKVVEEFFEGSIRQTISCVKTEQQFYVLRLKVEGCKNVQSSFEDIVREELMACNADPNNFQEATEIPLFGRLPPVLVLHLARFQSEKYIKLNDRYEFPSELDLDIQGLSMGSEKDISNLYTLHSVHVHTGDRQGGHDIVFIRPTVLNGWYKFDDHAVTKATEDMALEEQYGGHEGPSAYMLVYIRKTENELMCNPQLKDLEGFVPAYQRRVPSHIEIDVEHDLNGTKEQPPQLKLDWFFLSSEYLCSVRVFLSRYLDFGLVVNNLLAYSGFHMLLLGLDLLIENRLKNKIFTIMWEGLCWFIAVVLHVWIIRWINNKSNKTDMLPDASDRPIDQLEAIVDDLSTWKLPIPVPYIKEVTQKLRKLIVSIKKEDRYEDFMLCFLAATRCIYALLKEITSEKIGRGFVGLLLAHVGAMTIELIGALLAFKFIHKKSGSWFSLEWLL